LNPLHLFTVARGQYPAKCGWALALGRIARKRLSEAGHKRKSLPRAASWRAGATPADRLYPTKPDFVGRLPTDESAPYRGKVPNDQRETAEDLMVYDEPGEAVERVPV
jgi:hypothetical protein